MTVSSYREWAHPATSEPTIRRRENLLTWLRLWDPGTSSTINEILADIITTDIPDLAYSEPLLRDDLNKLQQAGLARSDGSWPRRWSPTR